MVRIKIAAVSRLANGTTYSRSEKQIIDGAIHDYPEVECDVRPSREDKRYLEALCREALGSSVLKERKEEKLALESTHTRDLPRTLQEYQL